MISLVLEPRDLEPIARLLRTVKLKASFTKPELDRIDKIIRRAKERKTR
jgi:hypothetical protein